MQVFLDETEAENDQKKYVVDAELQQHHHLPGRAFGRGNARAVEFGDAAHGVRSLVLCLVTA